MFCYHFLASRFVVPNFTITSIHKVIRWFNFRRYVPSLQCLNSRSLKPPAYLSEKLWSKNIHFWKDEYWSLIKMLICNFFTISRTLFSSRNKNYVSMSCWQFTISSVLHIRKHSMLEFSFFPFFALTEEEENCCRKKIVCKSVGFSCNWLMITEISKLVHALQISPCQFMKKDVQHMQ